MQIADFVARFQPAYRAYLPGLYALGPTTARSGHTLIIEVDQGRAPLPQQPPLPSGLLGK
jgi:D-glycerate 3-kinase